MAAGALCIGAIESCVLEMDRDRGAVRIDNLRHGRRLSRDVPLEPVRGVGTEEFRLRQARSWSVHLELEGAARVPLARTPLFTDGSAERTVGVIRSWLEESPT